LRTSDRVAQLLPEDKLPQAWSEITVRELLPFARIGGEEFVALLPSTNLDQSVQLAERFRTSIRNIEISVPEGVLKLRASFGCAELVPNGSTHLDLLAVADQALYRGKKLGRDCVVRSHLTALTAEVK
jgi:diguanylate cyclase (GGDEF)-like protein